MLLLPPRVDGYAMPLFDASIAMLTPIIYVIIAITSAITPF